MVGKHSDWMQQLTPIQFPGESNCYTVLLPLGVGAVIPPWNFPFAIMAGMTAASIAVRPYRSSPEAASVDSPTLAARVHELAGRGRHAGQVVNHAFARDRTLDEKAGGSSEDAVYCIPRGRRQ